MKKIIIIESQDSQANGVENIFKEGFADFTLMTLSGENISLATIKKEIGDLFIYNLSSFTEPPLDQIARISANYPYIPSIAITNEDGEFIEELKKSIGCPCLIQPLTLETLIPQIIKSIDDGHNGQIKGIPIHSLLQMFEGEEKTCSLRISHGESSGFVFMEKGVVIGAEADYQQGEDAIYTIITWDDAEVEILSYNGMRQQEIDKPLISLIMEGFRLKDERDSLEEKQKSLQKPTLDLKHFSTAGSRISLDVGSKIKIELDELETPLVATMIGMLPEQYLITTTPSPAEIVQVSYEAGNSLVVKYLHLGRLCMFRTMIVKMIEDPLQLLFLEYPSVVHYHELRRAKRTTIFIPCTLHLAQGPEFYGVLVDLSGLGCLCQIRVRGNPPLPALEIETPIQLKCLLPGLTEDQEISGIIKNYKRSSTETRVGIEFQNLEQYLKDSIERYVYSVESMAN